MKNRKFRHGVALIGLTLLFFSLICIVGVEAGEIEPTLAHKTPITFEFTNDYDGTFEKQWFSAHGKILHMRGAGHLGVIQEGGNLEGTLTYMGDLNLNYETKDGTGGGTVCFSVNYGDLSGDFEGRMVIKVNGGYITAMFVCHGDGDFEGMHLKGTAEGFMCPGGFYSANAVLLNPNA
ncbi:MAG: hypothetical protein KAW94_00330 [Candidatus Thorarchaeota archaeon]|nr:hypothetical protein [Candidatus Thorarchaeota archaeon]